MKTLILGDIHGRPYWKDIVEVEQPDRVIFIGDYFDAYDDYTAEEQMYNFGEIVNYKKSGKAEVIMLVGNHDYHYMVGVKENYSGYQTGARAAISFLLEEHKEHLQAAYQLDDFLFSHAGISIGWLNIHGYGGDTNIVDWVNDMWRWKPSTFAFAGRNPYGDSTISSPIWIRPKSLQNANYNIYRTRYIQVVGHTQQNKIDRLGKSTGGRYFYIDTLGTSGEYMMLVDGEIQFGKYTKE